MSQRKSRKHPRSEPEEFWYCCACAHGPTTARLNLYCVTCGHRRCFNCDTEWLPAVAPKDGGEGSFTYSPADCPQVPNFAAHTGEALQSHPAFSVNGAAPSSTTALEPHAPSTAPAGPSHGHLPLFHSTTPDDPKAVQGHSRSRPGREEYGYDDGERTPDSGINPSYDVPEILSRLPCETEPLANVDFSQVLGTDHFSQVPGSDPAFACTFASSTEPSLFPKKDFDHLRSSDNRSTHIHPSLSSALSDWEDTNGAGGTGIDIAQPNIYLPDRFCPELVPLSSNQSTGRSTVRESQLRSAATVTPVRWPSPQGTSSIFSPAPEHQIYSTTSENLSQLNRSSLLPFQEGGGCSQSGSAVARTAESKQAETSPVSPRGDRNSRGQKVGAREKESAATACEACQASETKQFFACPFYKRDPERYLSCASQHFDRIGRVRQHLNSKHGSLVSDLPPFPRQSADARPRRWKWDWGWRKLFGNDVPPPQCPYYHPWSDLSRNIGLTGSLQAKSHAQDADESAGSDGDFAVSKPVPSSQCPDNQLSGTGDIFPVNVLLSNDPDNLLLFEAPLTSAAEDWENSTIEHADRQHLDDSMFPWWYPG
ncbi:hypothetical protein GGR56DRAFT_118192 [Xylariaceae sp. FL0804]|nr:hypothetical protein GGR56DRAFT_118192 [Xylariaceae sp. FL0804]